MCGIAGLVNTSFEEKLEVLKNLELRGRDGFGFLSWHPYQEFIHKSLNLPSEDLNTKDFSKILDAQVVIGNTRATPTTEFTAGAGVDLQNQQPFIYEGKSLVFNGLISNDKELIHKYDLKTEAKVDTAMLLPLFKEVGIVEGMKQLEGAFAIVVFDKANHKLYFGKNFQPLYFYQENEKLIIASIPEMFPKELQDRVQEVKPYTCLIYDTETHNLETHSLYQKPQNKKALVIFSGGTDSVVTAWLYKHLGYDLTLLHFTYGQAAEQVEKWASEVLAKQLSAELKVFNAKPLFSEFKDSCRLLNSTKAEDGTQEKDSESVLSYVPNRNGIFAMIAAAVAEKEGCDIVAYGGQQMSSAYPDNTIDFAKNLDKTLKYSLNWNTNIKFTGPLINLMKHEIVALGLALGVPFDLVCSCYYPKLVSNPAYNTSDILVCGKCGCCQFRFSAFKMLGVKDTQRYESLPSLDWFDGLKDKLEWTKEQTETFIKTYVQDFV